MTQLSTGVALSAQATFGRDGAMFESLLGFVAQLSVVLWGLVIFTVVIRFVAVWIYRRSAARTARVAAVVASSDSAPTTAVATTTAAPVPAAAVATTTAAVATTAAVQPAAPQLTDAGMVRLGLFRSTPSMKVQRRTLRSRGTEPRSAAHVPALAANSTET
jgi:type IV secretory pathway TrbD component